MLISDFNIVLKKESETKFNYKKLKRVDLFVTIMIIAAICLFGFYLLMFILA